MDNPLKIIKNGILSGDWSIVCKGYESLTGETIVPKKAFETADELLRQMEELLGKYKKQKVYIVPEDLDKIGKSTEPIVLETYEQVPGDILPKQKRKSTPKPPSVTAPKVGHYGNTTALVTDSDIPKSEIKSNKEKAAITNQRKIKREAPKEYDVTCSNCDAKFKSDRPDTKDFGQKCRNCLLSLISSRSNSGN